MSSEMREFREALQDCVRAMDVARDTIQPITTAQIRLHNLNPQTDKLLDDAAAKAVALLARTEAGAVAMPLNDDEHQWLMYAVDHMLDDSEPEDKTCARVLQGLLDRCVVTSPAHTLEARDAARYRWIREKTTHEDWDGYSLPHVCDIDFKPGSQLNEMHETLDAAIDAAMRQEGGSDERS